MLPASIDLLSAEERATKLERRLIRRHLGLPPNLTIIDWAERHRQLPTTDGGGMWRIRQVPYLRAPLLALSNPRTQEVACKKSAQSGATIGLLLNWLFYAIDLDPCNILLLYPTSGEAEKFSKKKFAPAYREITALEGLIADPRSRQGDNTVLEKSFPGGSLGVTGGVSSRGLRMIDARRYSADDIDSLDPTSDEGDQIWLLRQRANAQWNAQGLWISSPGRSGASKITELYEEMERQGRFAVPCPHCHYVQVLRFGSEDSPFGLKWDRQTSLAGNGTIQHFPETAQYLCEGCGALIEERHKYGMVQAGEYLTEDREPVYDKKAKSYGFWYNAFVSLFPRVSWASIVDQFLKAKDDPTKLKVVVNTLFAETFDEVGEGPDLEHLEDRAQQYVGAGGELVEVPDGVGVLTAFADVQHDRIELEIRGWGAREVSWQILHQRIHGDTDRMDVFKQLDSWRTRAYVHESGHELRIVAMGVDSGDGSRVDQVYRYAAANRRSGVWATKGSSDRRMKEPIRVSKATQQRSIPLIHVNTYALKATLFARLGKERQPGDEPPAGFMHFRAAQSQWHNGSDAEFFAQFERERPRKKRLPNGNIVTEWVATGANEAIDLEVGNIAMLRLLQQLDVRFRDNLADFAEEARQAGTSLIGAPRRKRRVLSKGIA